MVKIDSAMQYDPVAKTAVGSLYADTKAEITSDMTVEGLMDGYTLGAGTTVLTASKEFGTLKSDGTWIW